ncbi:Type I restriction-modification system, DNA-methyltransferase subunit M [Mesoflavibacter sp. HG96]|uniref:N-6 DNA methylase n=1 Tax=unclassified Mesoflavibacter TaxID=2630131 RepID=UPI000D0E922D|nr:MULTISPECIES: N-6 DNA methylase [unclassified Mesoflavibacter]QIJ90180.1 Type I restriction-modification system, DNA-methyltransferase subunit M [Mesoflavibacter sp. HG96]QIJ92908.1 Type I restriction-modification system, DNA-methyltransferase subunit M [Mesoflavibacter sp. HG37]
MITKDNFKKVLDTLGFKKTTNTYTKKFPDLGCALKVDFKNEKLVYPLDKGFTIAGDFTTSFTQKENFVVFECVHRLFEQGYKPEHIELEPKWTVGHGASGGRADIMVKDNSGKSLMIIECKTAGTEFKKEWDKTKINGGQILSYAKQAGSTQFVALYASDFVDGKVKADYYLITLKDNEKLLEELADKEPLSFAAAKLLDKEDIYEAWTQTYDQHYETRGVFEDNEPYLIGKSKYSLSDLDKISGKDIQGKYHQFATILRQHNVSGRENAFDKLVNLFLCKIVDETNNPNELKFYWKGIAYDSYFDLQDRLQKLYQEGMKRFLGEEVTYIDNDAIEDAFRFFKNDPDATRETIKKYFRQLKFFTNNDFAFVDVHNEKLFYQNATVLLKMVQMLQDIRLKQTEDKDEEDHQFLGDMFEGFLDQGVKQSEGQFFTPMPIVKFILKALPLKQIVTQSEEIPKVIDYACGAGHFLNEYAKQIKPIVKENKEAELEQYYAAITGIEKEYRLSKVAKVSSFMYGQDDIEIIYADALSEIPKVKDKTYSVLVANPPYSVKGYLETLPAKDRKRYELINTVDEKSFPNNNSIETFFIERAKQVLKPGGVAAIIVPSSILSKGKAKSTSTNKNIYVATREILLKYFDIVAIAEFGSGTFGKTGTNTVTLFIRRKEEDPAPAKHYEIRVNDWFSNNRKKDKVFEDEKYIKQYCSHLEIDFKEYITLLKAVPSDKLLEHEIFVQYKKEFDKWSTIKHYKKSQAYKQLSADDKKIELDKRFTNFLVRNEKDKLYYFVLASQNPQEVLIVKSPSKSSEMKEFLGYEWSSAKGNEGIKYLGNATVEDLPEDDEEEGVEALESEDKRVLTNLLNFQQINTPLYDPQEVNNEEKINYWISQNFESNTITIPDDLQPFLSKAKLTEMLDFDRTDFSKTLSLSPKKTIQIDTQWEFQSINDFTDIIESGSRPKGGVGNIKSGVLSLGGEHLHHTNGSLNLSDPKYVSKEFFESATKGVLQKDDILICKDGALTGKVALVRNELSNEPAMINEHIFLLRCNEMVKQLYLFNFLFSSLGQELLLNNVTGAAQGGLNSSNLKNIKIPLPPKDIQQRIVDECLKIDKEAQKAEKSISEELKAIESEVNKVASQSGSKKINEVLVINRDSYNPTSSDDTFIYVDIDSVGKATGEISYSNKLIGRNAPSRARRQAINSSTIISTVRPYLKGFAYVENQPENTLFSTGFAVLNPINDKIILPKFIFLNFMYSTVLMKQMEAAMPKAAYPSINKGDIENFLIPTPSLNIQNKLIAQVEKHEAKIQKAKKVLETIAARKEEVIKKYL